MERQHVLVRLLLNAGRVVGARHMQRPDVQDYDTCNHEGEQIMEREEAVQRWVGNRIAAPEIGHDHFANARNGREQVGDNGCAPEAHLAPWQHIAHESGGHHQKEDDHAQNPEHFARGFV